MSREAEAAPSTGSGKPLFRKLSGKKRSLVSEESFCKSKDGLALAFSQLKLLAQQTPHGAEEFVNKPKELDTTEINDKDN